MDSAVIDASWPPPLDLGWNGVAFTCSADPILDLRLWTTGIAVRRLQSRRVKQRLCATAAVHLVFQSAGFVTVKNDARIAPVWFARLIGFEDPDILESGGFQQTAKFCRFIKS